MDKLTQTLLTIIQGSQEAGNPVIVYTSDIWQLVKEVREDSGVQLQVKNTPDSYITQRGYIWQRQNKSQFTLTI